MQSIHLHVAGRTDTGRVRRSNEDSFVVADLTDGSVLDPPRVESRLEVGDKGVLLAVADGMGGEVGGEVASSLTVESITQALVQVSPNEQQVKEAVQQAHEAVKSAGRERGSLEMGTTLTALLVQGDAAFTAEVGDSRAYLLRAGSMVRLTHDQNYAQLLIDAGLLRPEDADKSPMRHVLLQAIGGKRSSVHVELGRLSLRDRDCLLLCSDGLTKAASDEEIRGVVLGASHVDEACARLVDLANTRGGEDNVTVIVAGVSGELAPARVDEDIGSTFAILESFDPRAPR